MGLRDLEAFLRERAADFDSSLDTTAGAPYDNKVIQPLLRRVGIDPFTVDLVTFLVTRLKQAYPRMALDDGDNLTDLLVKANALLWDPIVRETTRVQRNLSLNDPTTLTLDEADSLGGNFFVPRRRGRYARGTGRILFSTPTNASINQNNFFTSRGGLVYFPTELQSIRTQEMALNVTDGNRYYFDVNLIAESPGVSYNINPGELNGVANLPAAVRTTNLQRFKFGEEEEDVIEYVARLQQSLGEKSMVTLRGIAAKVLEAFPEVNRLNVVGFNDPEMQRDVITGGGLGPILASGKMGRTVADGTGATRSRRFVTDEVDFAGLIGTGSVLTVIGESTDAGDYPVRRFIGTSGGDSVLELEDQVLVYGDSELRWFLRRQELTLSGIPGGILFPSSANGTVTVPDNVIHIGGAHDIHVRTSNFDEATITIANVSDDEPVLSGTRALHYALAPNNISLLEYVTPFDADLDAIIDQAVKEGWSLQILEGPNAGAHRIIGRGTTSGAQLRLVLDYTTVADPIERRWRIFDQINVDLNEPKETRITGNDLIAVQGNNTVRSGDGLNYIDYGVSKDDILRLIEGDQSGDYVILADPDPLVPDSLTVDREFARSVANGSYTIFKPNNGKLDTPIVRIRSIELLDSSSQPQGSFIPYAKPVDIQTRSFQNPARGVKHSFVDVQLGLVSVEFNFPLNVLAGSNTIVLQLEAAVGNRTVVVPSGLYATIEDLVDAISAAIESAAGVAFAELAVVVGDNRFGIRPGGNGYVAVIDGNGRVFFFGDNEYRTTADVRSSAVAADGGWMALDPSVDYTRQLDVLQILDGRSVGFYGGPFTLDGNVDLFFPSATPSTALYVAEDRTVLVDGEAVFFPPEIQRSVDIGTRSIGSARVYFLEPTSFEVNGEETVFSLDLGEAGIARFIPDPTLDYQQIPSQPDGDTPRDGSSANTGVGTTFTSASQNFVLSGIQPGDKLVVEYWPIKGSIQLTTDPIPNLAGKVFRFSVDDGSERVLTFIRDDTTIPDTDVTLAGVAAQINALAGLEVASLDSDDRLKFETDVKFTIRKDGSSSSSYPILLGTQFGNAGSPSFDTNDINNVSPHAGDYDITDVTATTLTVSEAFPADPDWTATISDQTFLVSRRGVQRINTTAMSGNKAEAGLYYFDVELISEGAGDFWNVDADLQMTVAGYKSDGYFLTTDDPNLAFSEAERIKLVVSRTILEQGVDDDPQNATQVTGQNLQITYDRVQTVENLQSFSQSDVERVVCASPLARHLIPHFVRFDLNYVGGSKESIVLGDVEKYIRDLFPIDTLDSSDLQKLVTGRGATYVKNPIDLLAVVHRVDRSIWIQRSQDRLSTTRLAAFIPDGITITRNVRQT